MTTETTEFATRAVHVGIDREKPYGVLITPIAQTAVYAFRDTAEMIEYQKEMLANGEAYREEYGRYGNPTVQTAERKLAALEGGERALLFSTGMCAVTMTLLSILDGNSHLIMTLDCYRRTRHFCRDFLPRYGVETTIIPASDYDAMASAIQPNTRVIITESPTNPYLRVMDLARTTEIAHKRGIKVLVDSTLGTPYNQKPLELGVDLVIHSTTKYLGGHNDTLAGVVIGSWDMLKPIKKLRGMMGGILGPQDAYLLLRGIKTLPLRVARLNETGLKVAQYLENHSKVARVFYPGLPSHPDYETARQQMRGFGGVVSFELAADLETTGKFIDALRIPYIAPSFGGPESLVTQPAIQSFYELTTAQRQAIGIGDSLVRYSCGLEDAEDLIRDLEQALASI